MRRRGQRSPCEGHWRKWVSVPRGEHGETAAPAGGQGPGVPGPRAGRAARGGAGGGGRFRRAPLKRRRPETAAEAVAMGSESQRGPAAARGPGQGDPRALRRDCQHRWAGDRGGAASTGGSRSGDAGRGLREDRWGGERDPEQGPRASGTGEDPCRSGRGQRPWVPCRHAGVGAGPNRGLLSPLQLHVQLHSPFFCANNLLWVPGPG